MKNTVDNIVKDSIQELIQDERIISIFLVGSMVNDNYIEKKYNDYDIRFIVKDINVDVYEKITKVLDEIKDKIEKKGIACQVSDVIGPVKMNSNSDRNVLIHGITMTEKDLDDLPNIHKYSYSSSYAMISGNDLIKKYKNIVIKPSDIISSIEGIEFCINLIKKRENSCNKWVKKNNEMVLEREFFDINDEAMIELFNYSYKKAVSNINNMIKTNRIRENISSFLELSDNEKVLISKIESNTLCASDIKENINTMISILYKLEKCTIEIYSKKNKYFNSLDWGIINESLGVLRSNGFDYLKKLELPVGNNFIVKYKDYLNNKEEFNERIKDSEYLVMFEPPNNAYQKYAIFSVNNTDQIDDFIKDNDLFLDNYCVSFVEMIKVIDNSFAGVLMSDGKGSTIIEIVNGTCDSRELTSRGVDPKKTRKYESFDFEDELIGAPKIIKEIKDICQYFKGYYEFAYGSIRGEKKIYFTFYSSNDEYINIFKGGKKYGKTL